MGRRPKVSAKITQDDVDKALKEFLEKGGEIKKEKPEYSSCYFQVSTTAISNFDIIGELDFE